MSTSTADWEHQRRQWITLQEKSILSLKVVEMASRYYFKPTFLLGNVYSVPFMWSVHLRHLLFTCLWADRLGRASFTSQLQWWKQLPAPWHFFSSFSALCTCFLQSWKLDPGSCHTSAPSVSYVPDSFSSQGIILVP